MPQILPIQGRVVASQTQDLTGVRVLAVDRGPAGTPSVMLTATCAADGSFELPLATEDLLRLFRNPSVEGRRSVLPLASGSVELSLTAYRDRDVIGHLLVSITLDGLAAGYSVEIQADEGDSYPSTPRSGYLVFGQVADPRGVPARGVEVAVMRRQLRREVVLATTQTGIDGSYRIRYEAPADAAEGQFAITLLVQQTTESGDLVEIHRSDTVSPAPPALELDLTIGEEATGSELEVLAATIDGEISGTTPQELTDEDVEFLSSVTGNDLERVGHYVRGLQLASDTGAEAAAFYALAQRGVPSSIGTVAALGQETLRTELALAAEQGAVPAWDDLDQTVSRLVDLARDRSIGETEDAPFGRLLATAGVEPDVRRRFLDTYSEHTGNARDLWQAIEAQEGADIAESLRFGLQTSAIAANHLPMVQKLRNLRELGNVSSARDLARFGRGAWRAVISGDDGFDATGVPEGFPGADEDEQRDLYASTLARAVEDLFPTEALVQRVAHHGHWSRSVSYVDEHPDLDFRQTRIGSFVAENPPTDGGDATELVQELKVAQRLFMVAPRFDRDETALALLDAGFHSAQQIVATGKSAFAESHAEALGGSYRADLIYDNADQISATVMTLMLRHSAAFNPRGPAATGGKTIGSESGGGGGGNDLPDLEGLLGPLDYCGCKSCRSVLSPAAYLVDLLRFVENRPVLGDEGNEAVGESPFDALLDKRPDLVHILLDCANTNTVLPTLDLVNEILERAVAGVEPAQWPQTTRTAEELRAHPEHLLTAAYDELGQAVFPAALPFDLPLEETRAYLDHLGAPLSRLLEVLGPAAPDLDDTTARERLGLNSLAGAVVAGEPTGHQIREWWGFDGAGWIDQVRDARTFLHRAGLGFEELAELEQSRYLGDGDALGVDFETPCQLEGAEITGLDEALLGRVHRFLRLRTATERSTFELDSALAVLGGPAPDALDATFLRALAEFEALRERFPDLPYAELLAWHGDLETLREESGERSFYERAFVEPAQDGEPGPFAPGQPPAPLSDHLPELAAALGVAENEVLALLAHDPAQTQSNLASLSWLYRWASLARALERPVQELLALVELSGVSPFLTTGPEAVAEVRRFVALADEVSANGLDLETLDGLLRDRGETQLLPGDLRNTDLLVELIRGLQTVRAEHPVEIDPSRPAFDGLVDKLSLLLDEEARDLLLARVREPVPGPVPALPAAFASFLSATTWNDLHTPLPDGESPDVNARAGSVLVEYLPYLRRRSMVGVVVQKLADGAGLSPALTSFLLAPEPETPGQRLDLFVAPDAPVVDAIDFSADAEILGSQELSDHLRQGTGGFPDLGAQLDTVRWLHKVALLSRGFDLDDAATRWLFGDTATGLLHPADLPQAPVAGPSPLFEPWVDLGRFVRLAERLGSQEIARNVFSAADGEVLTALEATDWDPAETADLATHLTLGDDDLRSVAGLERLAAGMELAASLGVAAGRAASWAQPSASFESARDIKAAARSQVPADRWPAVAEPLRNTLRELQRDALVGYLLARDADAETPEDLFGRFLIDVQVSSCARTSRVKQALSSLQTFVQRVALNLEPGVNLSSAALGEWQWLKQYRVWEANRKIFLWPENWLEPELRDNKTELFEAFESRLLERELTPESAEDALIAYVEELDQISRLFVAGTYHEREHAVGDVPAVDVLHVFARTHARPFKYFYRKLIDRTIWTPWESVPLEIKSDSVIPTTFNRRLMLYWPSIERKADRLSNAAAGGSEPKKHHEIRMSWSELRAGEWSQPKQGAEIVNDMGIFNNNLRATNERSFFFHTWPPTPGSELVIQPSFEGNGIFGSNYHHTKGFRSAGGNADLVRVGRPSDVTTPVNRSHFTSTDWLPRPMGTRFDRQWFSPRSDLSANALVTLGLRPPIWRDLDDHYSYPGRLIRSPYRYTIVAPRQAVFYSQSPFFYQDTFRSFCVLTEHSSGGGELAESAGAVHTTPTLEGLARISHRAYLPSSALLGQETSVLTRNAGPAANPALGPWETWKFYLEPFSHPFTGRFLPLLRRFGVDGLYRPIEEGDGEGLTRQVIAIPRGEYEPGSQVKSGSVVDLIDFDFGGAYADYDWELFFHAPMYMALRLMEEKKFEEAQRWMHFVFDPTDGGNGPTPARFWRVKPFFHHEVTSVDEQLESLHYTGEDGQKSKLRTKTLAEISHWRKNPFRPHALARLRTAAYQRWVVMRYLDNLLEWADFKFRQDNHEANNEALQLYVLAAQILGPRPVELPAREAAAMTYAEVQGEIDAFSNFVAEGENFLPSVFTGLKGWQGQGVQELQREIDIQPWSVADAFQRIAEPETKAIAFARQPTMPALGNIVWARPGGGDGGGGDGDGEDSMPRLYFCVPANDELLRYWNQVEDRLFKLRHCLNIEGVFRQLPLFQPPIDPGLLAQATAAGVDLATALSDLGTPLPTYRFGTMIGLAKELAAEVRTFGSALSEALRSRDAEALAELRSSEEVKLLETTRRVREQRITEAESAIDVLDRSRELARHRRDYYGGLKGKNAKEKSQLKQLKASAILSGIAGGLDAVSAVMSLIPSFKVGINGMGPETTVATGGQWFYHSFRGGAEALRAASGVVQTTASMAGIEASYERRDQDWAFQKEQAEREIARVEQDKIAARMRIDIARRELHDHDAQIDSSRTVDAYMQDRYTSSELYRWMGSELSRTYFQAYQLAFDIAKQAQRCYQFELGAPESSFIDFGYWDNRRKGLLAGDRLLHDLRRMETSFLANNQREYELHKKVSLASLDPVALQMLRQTGACEIDLPEAIFDLDHPGHYMRRLKTVSLTIPAVAGPYTNVNGRLTLTHSSVRTSADSFDDPNQPVVDNSGTSQSIATSSGLGDSGLFELSFRDERYLPFEGRGAVSHWRLELPGDLRQFDYQTIEDVILEVSYTAREGGLALADQVLGENGNDLQQRLEELPLPSELGSGLMRVWSSATHFPDAFARFLGPEDGQAPELEIEIDRRHFPHPLRPGAVQRISRVHLLWLADATPSSLNADVIGPDGISHPLSLVAPPEGLEGLRVGSTAELGTPIAIDTDSSWRVTFPIGTFDTAETSDLLIAVEYSLEA